MDFIEIRLMANLLDAHQGKKGSLASVGKPYETDHLFISFYLSHAYRDPTIPTTQYDGLCHVTHAAWLTDGGAV